MQLAMIGLGKMGGNMAERIRQGRTQAEVGAAAGFPNNAERRIYMYEAGIHRPPAGPLRQWADGGGSVR